MSSNNNQPMKAIILYDSRTSGGSTDRLIDMIGTKLAESGAYVEKAKCKATGDYSFVQEFDVIIMGAPVYYLLVSSQLLGALVQSNLKKYLKRKKIALFLACGSPEPMALVLYMPQLKMHMVRNRILAEKVFAPHQVNDQDVVEEYVDEIVSGWRKAMKQRSGSIRWDDEAIGMLEQIPSFFQGKIRMAVEEYAEEFGISVITPMVLAEAKADTGGF